MKKIASSIFFLISIFLFQQILFADNINRAMFVANFQKVRTTKKQQKAIKESFYHYVNVRKYEKIIPIAQKLLNFKLSKKEKYIVFFNLAKAYLNTNKLQDAVAYGLEAEYLYPKKIEIKLLLGMIYKNNRLYELAIEKYKNCLDLSKDNIEALINLGYIYNFQENYKISLSYFQKAESLLKGKKNHLSIDDYICMAISAKEIGLINQAQDILENIEIKNKKASLLLSQIYLSKQELEKAQDELIPYVYKEDTDIEIYCNLAKLYILSKKFNHAKDLLLYFESKNDNKSFEAVDVLLVETLYNICGDKQKALNKLNSISNYTDSKYIQNILKKIIAFEESTKRNI
jgi:tetratricopeptide (TPR) repeat protein